MNIDLDEIKSDRFVINNDRVRPFLRGEGVTQGKFFDLGTWRRDGLIARIRGAGFNVRTFADRIAALPAIGDVASPGDIGVRVLSSKERIATFDRQRLRWIDQPAIEQNGRSVVKLRANTALRRRRSRGSGDYYIAVPTPKGEINLRPVSETDALLHAYAQIARSDPPATLRFSTINDAYFVPQDQALLPPPHRAALDLIARDQAPAWTIPQSVARLAEDVFGSLGLELQQHEFPI